MSGNIRRFPRKSFFAVQLTTWREAADLTEKEVAEQLNSRLPWYFTADDIRALELGTQLPVADIGFFDVLCEVLGLGSPISDMLKNAGMSVAVEPEDDTLSFEEEFERENSLVYPEEEE